MRWTYASWDDLVRIDSRALGVWRRLIRHRRDNAFRRETTRPTRGSMRARRGVSSCASRQIADCLRVHPRNRVSSTRAGSDEIVDSAMEFHRFSSVKRAAPFRVQLALHHARPVSPAGPGARSSRRCPLGERIGPGAPLDDGAPSCRAKSGRDPPRARAHPSRRGWVRPAPRPSLPRPPPKGTRPARPLRSAARRRFRCSPAASLGWADDVVRGRGGVASRGRGRVLRELPRVQVR